MNQNAETIKTPINLAFLGCGFATRLHSKTLSAFRDQVRCFYASRSKARAESYNHKYHGQGAFDSYQSAMNSEEIDVVLVATPPAHHLDLTLQALSAGKHVIVEKPPFLKSTDFDTVRKEQERSGKRVFIAENYFYKPLLFKLRELIRSEVIGKILFVHINALKQQKIEAWRGDENLSGGGALFEGGIHWINFISNLGLRVKSVKGFIPGSNTGMDKSILVALEYDEGAVGAFYYSWETPSLFKGLRISKIYGKRGSITFESNGIFIAVRGKKKSLIFPGLRDIAGYKGMFRDFIQSIQENKASRFTVDLAEQDLKLIEDIYRSV